MILYKSLIAIVIFSAGAKLDRDEDAVIDKEQV